MALLDATRALEAQIAKGLPEPEEKPSRLPMQAIREIPEVFQQRDRNEYEFKAHAQELHKVPKAGNALDPVTVFWVGNGWAVIDGHHRMQAYRLAKWRKEVPVRVFSGKTLEDARLYSGQANGKSSLVMTGAERQQFAWRMRVTSKHSKAAIMKASGMSDGWMAECQRVFKRLHEEQRVSLDELVDMRWHDARRKAREEALEDTDWDSAEEAEAKELANKLSKLLGKRMHQHPHVLAMALEIYDRHLPDTLRAHWDEERGAFSTEEPEEEPDF